MTGMATHVVHSVKYGELHVVTTRGDYGHGRSWRSTLDPVPIRLGRVTSFDGVGELDVLVGLLRQVELYDAEGVLPRQRESDREG
jgi:hypothetical protein